MRQENTFNTLFEKVHQQIQKFFFLFFPLVKEQKKRQEHYILSAL